MNGINVNQKKMLGMLNGHTDSYDFADEQPQSSPASNGSLRMGKLPGNPPFESNFDIQVITKYFTVAATVYTEVAAAALNAALKTKLAAFIFGQSDFQGGFAASQGQFPLTGGWAYDLSPFVYGVGALPVLTYGVPDATAKATLAKGDLVIPFTATVGGVFYQAFVIIRCGTVSYGSLLDALSSDRFWINNIRYVLSDTSASVLQQYNNQLFFQRQTLYGKFKKDAISPNSQKMPEQFQAGIVDLPVNEGIDKNGNINLYVKYDAVDILLSVFVKKTDKILA